MKRHSCIKTGSVLLMGLLLACSQQPSKQPALEPSSPKHVAAAADALFAEVTEERGIGFVHWDGRAGHRYYVETTASGGGFLDYDGDGDLDLYLINGSPTPGSPKLAAPPHNALYENRDGRFVDVSRQAGVADEGYGMGMCVGDVNGDGLLDFYVTNFGANRLYINQGEGVFAEQAKAYGVAGNHYSASCAFGDLDSDGDLDLYVTNYVDFSFENNPRCGDPTRDLWSYCRPSVFKGQVDQLYINDGSGQFREEAKLRGIAQTDTEKGLGVVLLDLNQDLALDILVANDGEMNRLYLNDGKGYFTDASLEGGFGYNGSGVAEAGMGIAVGDVDGDQMLEILVTNYAYETNTLYQQRRPAVFEDVTFGSGLQKASYLPVGWGAQFFDANNNGSLDLAVANGHVVDNIAEFEPEMAYAQANQLFLNDGTGRFADHNYQAGTGFTAPQVSRGLAVGDWNNDGKLDLLITNTNAAPSLLENHSKGGLHWVGFQLVGSPSNAFAIGARCTLFQGRQSLGVKTVRSGGSFLSQDDLRVHFGLNKATPPLRLEVLWPHGQQTTHIIDAVNTYHTVRWQEDL